MDIQLRTWSRKFTRSLKICFTVASEQMVEMA